ncbi:MAG: DUF2240 family protein [Candidatus Thermoplasmatota archaeon]|nr:DUF2240 family protein [Candidatus Thermoplasmatota archaeon]
MGEVEKLKEVIAFLYNRSGKEEMPAQELRLAMSMDLRWFSPKEAEEIVDTFQNKRLLVRKGSGGLRPAFNYRKLTLERDFRPSMAELLGGSDDEPLFIRMVGHITDRADEEKRNVIAMVNRKAGELGIEVEAAAMLVGDELSIDMGPLADEALDAIADKAK